MAVTATSFALVSSVPLTRERADARAGRAARRRGVVALARARRGRGRGLRARGRAGRHARARLDATRAATGAELGRLVVYLAPWMVASVAVRSRSRCCSCAAARAGCRARGRARSLVQVPVEWVLRAAFGLAGVAVGMARSRRSSSSAISASLARGAADRSGSPVAAAVVRRARARRRSACPGSSLGAVPLPSSGSSLYVVAARGLASGRPARRLGLRARVAVAFAAVPARVKQLVRRLGRTGVGKNLIHASVLHDPATMRFPNVEQWPPDVRGFEDLAFLFSSNQLNHGVASLQIDEAALLYRLARDATSRGRSSRSAGSRAAARSRSRPRCRRESSCGRTTCTSRLRPTCPATSSTRSCAALSSATESTTRCT